jgi:hypothetical protein
MGPNGTLGGEPTDLRSHDASGGRIEVRALLPTVRVPTLVVQHADDLFIPPALGKYVADHISGAKYVELPGRNMYHFVEPWRASFQEIYEFLTGHQAEVTDDRVLATMLFTDIGGIAVHIGARVSALAGPNEVLVSSTLRDLVIGSGLEFEERGAHELKGVPGEWHLFAVASV